MKTEQERIKERYEERSNNKEVQEHSVHNHFIKWIQKERNEQYLKVIKDQFKDIDSLNILEIGAGEGGNISFFLDLGIPLDNIHVNELIPERVQTLKERFPGIKVFEGDALEIPDAYNGNYDIVFQSTVFTSILDGNLKRDIANKMSNLLSGDGFILWYDFVYNNPKNPDVQGVPQKEVKELFKDFKFIYKKKVTLAPPIGRRVKQFYPLFNIPPLRTHFLAGLKRE